MPVPLQPATSAAEDKMRGIALRLGAVAAFACMGATVKFAAEAGAGILEICFYRQLFAVPMVLAWALAGPGLGALRTKRPGAHATRTVVGVANMLFYIGGLVLLPLADATAISFSGPLWATLLSALVLHEKVGRHRWTALALGFVGVLIVVRPGGNPLPPLGLTVAMISAFGAAIVAITIRQVAVTENIVAIVFWFTAGGSLLGLAWMPFVAQWHTPAAWGWLAAVAFFGVAAQFLQTGSLRHARVGTLAPFDYFQLICATAVGWAIWGTKPTLNTLAGAALIVVGGLYVAWRERQLGKAEHAPATPEPIP